MNVCQLKFIKTLSLGDVGLVLGVGLSVTQWHASRYVSWFIKVSSIKHQVHLRRKVSVFS